MIAIVILAGGKGQRIGGDKPARLLNGKRLLDHALALAKGWSPLVAVSVEKDAPDERGLSLLRDRIGQGPIAGIEAALAFSRSVEASRVLTIPCDTPFLPMDLPDRLSEGLGHSAAASIASSGGRLHPTCGLWCIEVGDALPAYLTSNRSSLHGFAKAVGANAVEWPSDPDDPFFNINTEADLAAAEARIRSR